MKRFQTIILRRHVVRAILISYKHALISCAETLQYESSTLPATQMNQDVLPEMFTKKQQHQSRMDGGTEMDGTQRKTLAVTEPELRGHIYTEQQRAHSQSTEPCHTYSALSLRGCHQSLSPSYRLPFNENSFPSLDPYGMVDSSAAQPPRSSTQLWQLEGNDNRVIKTSMPCEALFVDASKWSLSFVRDFRALHQFNHDHDCTSTCIKYIKKGIENAKQAVQQGKSVACRFFFFVIRVFTFTEDGVQITKRIRRKGKELVTEPRIATTNAHNELGRVLVQRDTPFRSPSSDFGQALCRSNFDLQFMPRAIEISAEESDAPQIDPALAKAMYGVRFKDPGSALQRRIFYSIVAMFQASHNCDYYITKYQAKPMEQLQNLFANIALGLRRLQLELEAKEDIAEQLTEEKSQEVIADKARRVTLRIQAAANRSSWCSACELATFVNTGSTERKTHRPKRVFLRRPMFFLQQSKRLLRKVHMQLIEAADVPNDDLVPVNVICVEVDSDNEVISEDEDLFDPHADDEDGECFEEDMDQALERMIDQALADSCNIVEDMSEAGGEPVRMMEEKLEQVIEDKPIDESNCSAAKLAHSTDSNAGEPDGTADACQIDDEEETDKTKVTTLRATTSAHDDWLHRGPWLYDLDFYTYS